MKVLLPDL